jgi:hypothetical protein
LVLIALNNNNYNNNIDRFQNNNTFLTETLSTLETIEKKFCSIPEARAQRIKNKYEKVFTKNKGMEKLKNIPKFFKGESVSKKNNTLLNYTIEEIPRFKYAPVSSSDVERSFLIYKQLVPDHRMNFWEENFKHHIVIQSNIKL